MSTINLNEIRELLLEKVAVEKGLDGITDEEVGQVDAFIESFVKESASLFEQDEDLVKKAAEQGAFWQPAGQDFKPPNSYSWSEELKKGTMGALANAGIGALVGGAIYSLGKAIQAGNNSRLHAKFLEAVKKAIQMNSVLQGADKEKVLSYAESIFRVAPNIATDPNLLASVLANAIHGEGIDTMTIRSLAELEGKHTGNTKLDTRAFR